jgi:hypothetical protein
MAKSHGAVLLAMTRRERLAESAASRAASSPHPSSCACKGSGRVPVAQFSSGYEPCPAPAPAEPSEAEDDGVFAQIHWTPEKLLSLAQRAVDDALGEFCRQSGPGNFQVLKEARGSLGAGCALGSLEKALRIALRPAPAEGGEAGEEEAERERERLNAEIDRLIESCEYLTAGRDEARENRDRLAREVEGLREAVAYAREVAEKCSLDHGHEDEAHDCGHDSFETCIHNLAGVLARAASPSRSAESDAGKEG